MTYDLQRGADSRGGRHLVVKKNYLLDLISDLVMRDPEERAKRDKIELEKKQLALRVKQLCGDKNDTPAKRRALHHVRKEERKLRSEKEATEVLGRGKRKQKE